MSIVFITIHGNARQWFASKLAEETEGALELVIIQRPQPKLPVTRRISRFFSRHVGWQALKETWYALLMRLHGRKEKVLTYFTLSSADNLPLSHKVKVLEVDSVNSDAVHAVLQKLSPDLIVVWSSTILDQRILKTAKRAINLHFGLCPYYRGALANQYAVLSGDFSNVGATIHYINGVVDKGDILATVTADLYRSPRDMFIDLNDRAINRFLDIASRLHKGEDIPASSQDGTKGKNLLLKSWTPSVRYRLGTKVIQWEKENRRRESKLI